MKRKSLEEAQSYAMSFFDKLLNDKRYALEQRESTKELIESAVKCGYIFAGNEKTYSEEEVKVLTLDAVNLGMTTRQNQLNGSCQESGNDLHNEWFEQKKKK